METYSQYREDLVIDALFSHKRQGFYVDVGANDPDVFSNTKLFYNKGWRGINVEPDTSLYTKLCAKRDRDINLNIGAGPEPGVMTFYRMSADTLSSFNKDAAIQAGKLYGSNLVSEEPIPVMKLADILEVNLKGMTIDFLSVDAEGYDLAVLKSNNWSRYQPSVIIVEINVGGDEIIKFLKGHDYLLIFNNGTNGIFVSRKFFDIIDDDIREDLAKLGQKQNLETFFPCSVGQNNLVLNFVYGQMRHEDSRAVHRGSISIIWSTLPIEGCDVYVYHNAFSYKGKKGGIDYLLMLEPVVVLPGEFDERVWKYFDHIFGPFDALTAQGDKFHKILFPRSDIPGKNPVTEIQSRRESLYPLSGRKNAICMISGNKGSHVPSELYSKRVEAAQWFAEHSKIHFDVYGKPPFALPNYRGAIPDGEKLSVMKQYRYNLCFENTNHPVLSAGYVTEKILDCVETRTIPIYWGASNIEQYIPPECFIDFRKFSDFRELDIYLHSISEKEYKNYIDNIDAFACGGGLGKFSESSLYNDVVKVLIDEKSLDAKYLSNDVGWRPGLSPALRKTEWKTSNGPTMWTWKHLLKAEPPVLENGKIIDKRKDKSIDHTGSTSERGQKYFLIGKKPSIRVLAAGTKFSSGNARQGYDYGWWNLFDALTRFENIEMQFFDYATEAQQRGVAGMSERLEEIVRKENPDLFFYSPSDLNAGILRESLTSITDNTDTQTVIWMNNHQGHVKEETKLWATCADYIITTSHETASDYIAVGFGAKIIKSQWGFNPLTYAVTPSPKIREISFCGTAKGNRSEILKKMKQSGLSVDIFGSDWHEDSFIPFYDMVRIFGQSRINLNLCDTSDLTTPQINRRTFEVPGCRWFLLTMPADHLEEYYEPDKEVVIAASLEELIDKSKYYLAHERERESIAQRGYERTLAEHTWFHRLRDIFKHIGFTTVPKQLTVINSRSPFTQSFLVSKPVSAENSVIESVGEQLVAQCGEKIETSIAVMAYNKLEYTRQCVESILHYTKGNYELLLTDNGSTDGTFEYFEWVKSFHPHTLVIKNFANRIAESLIIHVVSLARGKYIAGVANDALVHEGWLENFIRHMESAPDIGIVGSRSNSISGPQVAPAEYDTLEAYHTFAADWSKKHQGSNFAILRLVPMTALLKKSSTERIGFVDPDLPTNGRDGGYGFSDDDFSLRLRLAGYRSLVANDVLIHHFGSVTSKQYRPDLFGAPQNINKEKYMKKLQRNDRVTIGPHGELTLKPYSLDDHIPVAENTVIRSPRICIVESDAGVSEAKGHPISYAALADSYHGEVVSLGSNSIQPLLTQTITGGEYDFIALVAKCLAPSPEKVQALIETALCYPDVAIVVPIGNYAPSTHARRAENGKGVETIQYADLSICVINTKIIRPLIRPLTQIENDEEWFWFLQRRIRGEGYFIAKCNNIIVDSDEPRVRHPYDTQILPGKLVKEKKYEEAIAVYKDDLSKDPTFVESLYQLAYIAKEQHQTTEAIKHADDALRIDPHHIQSLILLSEVFLEQGDVKRAEAVVRQTNFKQPGNPEVQEVVAQYEQLKTKIGDGYDEAKMFVSEDVTCSKIQFKKKAKSDMVSIIIPVTGHSKQLKKCIENIKKYTPEAHEIIFVDNGCRGAMLKWIRQTVKRKSNYRLIKAGKEAALGKCFNMGMEASSGEYIILLRDHVIVAEGWLDGMLKCIDSANDMGIVGPMTNGKAAGIQCAADSDHLKIDQFKKYAGAFLERNRHRRVPSREVADFCILFRRNLVEHIGPFDEELEQGSESDDYCLRAALEGYNNFIAGDVFVLCGALPLQESKRFFNYKWGDIDAKSHDGERLGVLNAITGAERLYQREEVDKAIVKLIDGIKYRPDEEAIYHRLAEMLIDCERFKEGLEAISSIPEDKRDNARTLELTGYCKAGMELHDEAAQYADRALSLNGSSAPALNLKGVLTHKKGNNKASEDFFKKATVSDPGYGKAYTNLGILAWEAGRKDDALELFEKGFILSSTVADSITAYHSAISETAEFERSEGVFREAKTLYTQSRRIAFLLIDILIQQEKYESAMQDIRKAMITFEINDGILSAAQAVLDRFNAQEIKDVEKKPALSLCMIVKDEEDCLARCLMSAIPVVDEIVIVDTGSTDRTKDIAKVFGAKVYDFEWNDDFSEARNFSLSKATGEWIFVLDADEVISPIDYEDLGDALKCGISVPVAYSITTRNYVRPMNVPEWVGNDGKYREEEAGNGWYPSPKIRLFTNDPRMRFEGRVHELIEPSLKKIGISPTPCSVPIHHYGKLIDTKNASKGEEYYLLGKKKIEDGCGDIDSLTELAKQAAELKRHDEAIELWQQVIGLKSDMPVAYLYMSIAYMALGDYKAGLEASKKALHLDPALKEAALNYSICALCAGDPKNAILILETLLQHVPGHPVAMALLSGGYCIVKDKEKAFNIINRIKEMGFECANYIVDLAERLVSSNRIESGILLLEAAVESGNDTREIRELLDSLLTR